MSDLRKWFTGEELLKQLRISIFDLADLVEAGKLPAHHPETSEPVHFVRHSDSLIEPRVIRTWDSYNDNFAGPSLRRTEGGLTFIREEPKVSIKALVGCFFLKEQMEALRKPLPTKKDQKWEAVRERAEELFNDNPEITIEDVARDDVITSILGRNYSTKVIRQHIKDLSPSRLPGRRRQKK